MTISASAGMTDRHQTIPTEQAERFAEISADHIVLAHFERAAVAGAHVVRRMMAEHCSDRHFFVARFIVAVDLP